jgi:hypothetical protein
MKRRKNMRQRQHARKHDIVTTLLGIAGKRVTKLNPFFHDTLLAKGKRSEETVMWCLGKPQLCHANASELWIRNRGAVDLCTGYALRKKEWYPHSWGNSKGSEPPLIYETTPVHWEEYYGGKLNEPEAVDFAYSQFMAGLNKKELHAAFDNYFDCFEWYMQLLERLYPERLA